MSFQSMAWAVRQKLPCSQKMVLVMLADRHNGDTGRCDPSHEKLAADCGLSRRTVIDHVESLAKAGFLSILHRSIDGYKTSNQYKLNLDFNPTKDVQNLHIGSAAIAHRSAAIAHIDVQPLHGGSAATAHKTVIEPVIEPIREKSAYAPPLPADLLADFLVVRKAKKAGPLTKTAVAGIAREAEKAGISLIDAVTACCEFGWQGFNAVWYAERQAKAIPVNKPAETAYQRSMRERVAEFSPSIAKQAPGTYPLNMTLEAENVTAITRS